MPEGKKKRSRSRSASRDSKRSESKSRKSEGSQEPAPVKSATPEKTVQPTNNAVTSMSMEFEAGQLFERFDKSGSGVIDREAFKQMIKEHQLRPGNSMQQQNQQPNMIPPAQIGSYNDFEAGRLFARHDKDGKGVVSKAQFAQMLDEMQKTELNTTPSWRMPIRQSSPLPSSYMQQNSQQSNNVQHQQPMNGYMRSFPNFSNARSNPSQFQSPNFSYPYSLPTGQDPVPLRSLDSALAARKESLLQLCALLTNKMHTVKTNKRQIELETVRDAESMLQRLNESEATKLATLNSDLQTIQDQIAMLDNFRQRFVSSVSDPRTMQIAQSEADQLCSRPLPTPTQVRTDDFPHEVQQRVQAESKVKSAENLLRVKDQMLFQLLKEREELKGKQQKAIEEVEGLSRANANEMDLWAKLTDNLVEALHEYAMVCDYCGIKLGPESCNSTCDGNCGESVDDEKCDSESSSDDSDNDHAKHKKKLKSSRRGRHHFRPVSDKTGFFSHLQNQKVSILESTSNARPLEPPAPLNHPFHYTSGLSNSDQSQFQQMANDMFGQGYEKRIPQELSTDPTMQQDYPIFEHSSQYGNISTTPFGSNLPGGMNNAHNGPNSSPFYSPSGTPSSPPFV
eukprot:TRINITY_DN56751_c0_g1_i1.p1 TRINITY_DN56751_c0_g1~~TRINITY_DN56751_c0_g1_i1.p1  ORF type:complete len:640 (-),score=168.07 TRINITY_DN56751_c0_g1_i1:234-2099(-)